MIQLHCIMCFDRSSKLVASLKTMADSAAGPEVSEASLDPCVILQAWKSSPTVMNRLIQGCLVFLPPETKKIKREHLGENVDLLGPMINNLGFLP